MKTANIQVEVPEYLTIGDYLKIQEYKGDSNFDRLVHTICSITNIERDEVRRWDGESIVKVASIIERKSSAKEEYHPLIEWNGQLYGYANIERFTLGEYTDLENLAKEPEKNLDQIAAILYRPVTKHYFDSLRFMFKQSVKIANNKVENIFDWYDIQPYDYKEMKRQAVHMKDFPVHIILGAMGFFLSIVRQYLNDSLFSMKTLSKTQMELLNNKAIQDLLESIGGGSGLSTNSVKPTFLRLQESPQ